VRNKLPSNLLYANNTDTRKQRFCWGIQNSAGYRFENNFVGSSK